MNILPTTKTNTAWQVNLDHSGVSCYITRDVLLMSGGEENSATLSLCAQYRLLACCKARHANSTLSRILLTKRSPGPFCLTARASRSSILSEASIKKQMPKASAFLWRRGELNSCPKIYSHKALRAQFVINIPSA